MKKEYINYFGVNCEVISKRKEPEILKIWGKDSRDTLYEIIYKNKKLKVFEYFDKYINKAWVFHEYGEVSKFVHPSGEVGRIQICSDTVNYFDSFYKFHRENNEPAQIFNVKDISNDVVKGIDPNTINLNSNEIKANLYYVHGELHRTNGPAIEYPSDSKINPGTTGYYLNGVMYETENDYRMALIKSK